MVLVLLVGCPPPDANPLPTPPAMTACGLIGRDCEVIRGTLPSEVVLADLDGDTDLDLAVVLWGSDRVGVWLNDGSGTFAATEVLAVGSTPSSAAAGDFDGDGDEDLAVTAVASVVGPAVSVLANGGNATFAPAAAFFAGAVATFVAAGDLDGDGDLDVVTANEPGNSVSVLLNDGDGTFAPAQATNVGTAPMSVDLADLDGDGDLDLAVANRQSNDVSILTNTGDGAFGPAVNLAAGDSPTAVAAGDFDGDGDQDLVVANQGGFDDPGLDDVVLLINEGSGAFSAGATLAVGVNPHAMAADDLDGDGDMDLVVANYGTTAETSTIGVLLNRGDATFAPVSNWATGTGPVSVAVGDLDGDGDLDVVTANYAGNDVSFLANDGSGGFGSGN